MYTCFFFHVFASWYLVCLFCVVQPLFQGHSLFLSDHLTRSVVHFFSSRLLRTLSHIVQQLFCFTYPQNLFLSLFTFFDASPSTVIMFLRTSSRFNFYFPLYCTSYICTPLNVFFVFATQPSLFSRDREKTAETFSSLVFSTVYDLFVHTWYNKPIYKFNDPTA